MMIQYDNIYADLSYIISKPSVYPLIKNTLEISDNKLRNRVLYGTDFYMVRNHKSDKNLYIDLRTFLGYKKFNLIARENPNNYLKRK